MNERENRARHGIKKLTEARFINFMRAVKSSDVNAVRLLNEDIDKGKSIDELFFTGDEYGYQLEISRFRPLKYKIEFGYLAGPLSGDRGEWIVDYDGMEVKSIQDDGMRWIP